MSGARHPASQHGGAYILALTALLVLTGLGIVLSGIALIERRLGSADQDRLQALNAADGGLALAAARQLAGAGSEELEVVFGATRSAGLVRASRLRVGPPVFVAAAACESCAAAESPVGRVSYALAALGERLIWPRPSSPDGARVVARVSVEATLTIQPWPLPGSPDLAAAPREVDLACVPEVRAKILEGLAREWNPPGCEFGPRPLSVRGQDPQSGASCTVQVPVCVLLTDWRER